MVEVADPEEASPPKKKGGKGGFVLGLIGALIAGGAGFYVVWSGMVELPLPKAGKHEKAATEAISALPNVAFVPLEPLVVSLSARARSRHLTFTGELEIEPAFEAEVRLLLPRVADVLNTYLRAVEERDIEDPAAMTRLRAQMLRRVQMVVGQGRVRDLLIAEFILN